MPSNPGVASTEGVACSSAGTAGEGEETVCTGVAALSVVSDVVGAGEDDGVSAVPSTEDDDDAGRSVERSSESIVAVGVTPIRTGILRDSRV